MDDQRFIDIETKAAYQEKMLEELHLALYAQQKIIDRLQIQLSDLKKRAEDTAPEGEIGPANEKPPHY
ncbi:MAG: SlyX family protein [Bdellovibrionales bacterium]|nr:SlyX family protein [Bdellovibrionales bacterium]